MKTCCVKHIWSLPESLSGLIKLIYYRLLSHIKIHSPQDDSYNVCTKITEGYCWDKYLFLKLKTSPIHCTGSSVSIIPRSLGNIKTSNVNISRLTCQRIFESLLGRRPFHLPIFLGSFVLYRHFHYGTGCIISWSHKDFTPSVKQTNKKYVNIQCNRLRIIKKVNLGLNLRLLSVDQLVKGPTTETCLVYSI